MFTKREDDYISIKTNSDDWFNVTIKDKSGSIIFSEIMRSFDKQIILKGFSLSKESITISPKL